MKRTVDFYDFEEARRSAGLFFARLLHELDISERTYYRWKASGRAPSWALKIVELLGGDLDHLGWKHWTINNGILRSKELSQVYRWEPHDLFKSLYCRCPVQAGLLHRAFGGAANDRGPMARPPHTATVKKRVD